MVLIKKSVIQSVVGYETFVVPKFTNISPRLFLCISYIGNATSIYNFFHYQNKPHKFSLRTVTLQISVVLCRFVGSSVLWLFMLLGVKVGMMTYQKVDQDSIAMCALQPATEATVYTALFSDVKTIKPCYNGFKGTIY